MTQTSKKASSGQSTARMAPKLGGKAARNAYATMESTRSSAENVVKLGSSAMKEFLSTSAGEAQKAQEKAFAMSREGAEQLARSTDAATRMMREMLDMSRENIEACVECGNTVTEMAKDLGNEMFECANRAFADSVETSREFFACRTMSDMVDLQNRTMRRGMDSFFAESAKLTNLMFEYAGEAMEPISERVAEATEQFGKAITA